DHAAEDHLAHPANRRQAGEEERPGPLEEGVERQLVPAGEGGEGLDRLGRQRGPVLLGGPALVRATPAAPPPLAAAAGGGGKGRGRGGGRSASSRRQCSSASRGSWRFSQEM